MGWNKIIGISFSIVSTLIVCTTYVESSDYSVSVQGTDTIFLSARTDINIPPLGTSDPSFPLLRYGFQYPTFKEETFPGSIPAGSGMIFSFNAAGSINYSYRRPYYIDPDGDHSQISQLTGIGGISGYTGPSGALVGVFLDDTVPSSVYSVASIDFQYNGVSTTFESLAPELGQVFFIGDGFTPFGDQQEFVAPEGATRLFLGVPDGLTQRPSPGYYEDNDGFFIVDIDVINTETVINAEVDVKPNKLNLKSKRKYVVAFIEPGDGYDAEDIDAASVVITEINGQLLDPPIHAVHKKKIGDHDDDGIMDLKVKFYRHELIEFLEEGEPYLVISGRFIAAERGLDGTRFEGIDTIKVKKYRKWNKRLGMKKR